MILHRIRAIAARTVLVCAAVALAPCLAGTAAVAGPPAGSDNRVGIAPADERDYTHISLPAGGTAKRPVQVTNFSTTAQDLLIYPADASITPQGGFALAERDAPLREVGAWAQLPVSQLHLAARSSKVVMFTLTVPTGTTPGDYAGGVVIQRARAGTASTVSACRSAS
ncbi:MAG: hypothetical protein AUG44_25305 [Actinobacteria bacterium 13_1_20CM_3_71_11]|nr:MAG: hypothetical protein AUG44_25305 [Actinobacteria bacterium 13_1_20CM_3_71_11]